MSDADRIRFSYAKESTFGTAPSGSYKDCRITSESIRQEQETADSQELRSDRQVEGTVRTNLSGAGGFNFELSYGNLDDFLEYLLQADATWDSETAHATGATDISFAAADQSINSSSTDLSGATVGSWIKVSGSTSNDSWYKVASAATNKITTTGGAIVDESAGDAVTIKEGSLIINGTTFSSVTIEKKFTDLSNEFERALGFSPDQLSLQVDTNGIITGSMEFVGKSVASAASSAGSGYTTAPTNQAMNSIDHVKKIVEGGSVIPATSFSVSYQNNLRARLQIASLGAISLGSGRIGITGTLQAYLTAATRAIIDKFLADTSSSLAIVFEDAAGNSYVFEFPQVKYTSGPRNASGTNTDILADLAWSATRNATENVTCRMQRWSA